MSRSPLIDVAWGYMWSQILRAAAELEIADWLADGPLTTAELAARTGADASSLRRILRALVALDVLSPEDNDRSALTEIGFHLRTEAPDSVRNIVLFLCSRYVWDTWGDVTSSVRTGRPSFDDRYGVPAFGYLQQHPEEAAIFNGAMSQHTREAAAAVIAGYDFSPFATVVDVGGGNGMLIGQLLRSRPGAKGVLFDLAEGVADADAVLRAAGVAERCQVVAGDFFKSVPKGGDAYVMKLVLHDWDDARAVTILRNCRAALPPGGKILVIERLLPETIDPPAKPLLLADLLMLVLTGGRERTLSEFRQLFQDAGFDLGRVTDPLPPLGLRVLEGVPTVESGSRP